ncbi:phage tail protein, partial [Streptomyces sp. SID13588]|nr:phage tail protein [Streptomyces sp. SID13588]
PVSWQGPSLDPANPGVATEVLEITHHGFTD